MEEVKIDTLKKLDEVWESELCKKNSMYHDIIDRGYHIEAELPKNGILFLGMNPSYPRNPNDNEKTYVDTKTVSPEYFGRTYDLQKISKDCLTKENDKNDDINYRYWGPIVDAAVRILCEECGIDYFNEDNEVKINEIKDELEFCHHDLFFVRETSQKKVLDMMAEQDDKHDYIHQDFFKKQFDLSKKIIEAASPKIIIVINGGAGKFIRRDKGYEDFDFFGFKAGSQEDGGCWDEECGVDIVTIGNRKVPVIFTGMLSSTGKINNGTKNTLFWNVRHISRILKRREAKEK